jgi:N-acetylneuraminic acid mutarotase
VINGKLYVAGGTGTGANSLATLEVYDPATNTWATKAPMPTARDGASGGVINGKLYVVGGDIDQNTKLTTLEVYDPATDTWTTKASMPTSRSGPGAVAIDGKLYVAGGCRGWCAPVTNVLEVYDPATDTWDTKAPLPTARGGTDVAVVNGLFYVLGGCCGGNSSESALMSKTIEVYNPTTNIWTAKTQHVVGGGDTAGSMNGKIYVAKLAATEVYDPATDTWAFLSPMPVARQYAAGGLINGKLYVAGGYSGNVGSATLEAYTLACIGDVNGDDVVNLADAILTLKVMMGMNPTGTGIRTNYPTSGADVNNDSKVNFAEVISTLQVISGLRFSVCGASDGVCGSSNGGTFTTAPSAGLCSAGSATSVTGIGPWSWSCTGANGGTTADCTATIQTTPVVCVWDSAQWDNCLWGQ